MNIHKPAFLVLIILMAISATRCDAAIRSSKIEADLRNGTVVSLKNLLTGESYASLDKNACLAGIYAVNGKTKMLFDSKECTSKSDTKSITQTAFWDGRSTSWTSEFKLNASDGITITQNGKSAAKGVYGISWGIAGIPDSLTVLVPGESGQRLSSDAPGGMRSFDYPYTWESPFVVIQGKKGGVIIYAEDPLFQFKSLFIEHVDGRFRIRFESRNQAPFDDLASIKSVKWKMQAYKGPWQAGAEIYSKWMASHIKPISINQKQPSWAKDIQLTVTMDIDSSILAELAKHVDPARTLLYVPGWRRDRYDRNYPDYAASPEFPGFVEAAHKLGFRVMAHANYFGCDPKHPLYAELSKYQIRDPFTKELQWWTESDPTIKIAYINPASKLWRTIFVSKMKELVSRYKVDALHIDETWVIINDANGLIDGMNCIQGNIQLHKDLYTALPQTAISGEGLNEATCIYESFAQRHVIGIDTWHNSWNNQRLDQAHPISSYILAPYTTMIGLWLPNTVDNPDLYMAWRRAYEHYGVIPALSRPRKDQLDNPTLLTKSVIDEIRFFQKYEPKADFKSSWKQNDIFRYNINDGRKVFYRKDNGVVFEIEDQNGKTDIFSRHIFGVRRIKVDGSIPDWLAYNKKEIIGLNPEHEYIWNPEPRNDNKTHVSEFSPADFVLSQPEIHSDFMQFRLDSKSNSIDLWNYEGKSASGVHFTSGEEKIYSGINFTDASGGVVQTEGQNLFMHPPWKTNNPVAGTDKIVAIGQTFVEYNLNLPSAKKITLSAGAALKEEAVGKSDGITITAEAGSGSDSLSASVNNDKAEPKMLNLDLTRYAGKQMKLRIEINPGPAGSVAYDLGMLIHPIIEMENNQPGSIDIVSDKPIAGALTSSGKAIVTKIGANTYRLNLTLPNTITVTFAAL